MEFIIEDMMAKLQKSETFGGRLTEAREEAERWDKAGIGYTQGELADLAAQDLANIPDDDGDQAAQLAAQLAAHDAAIAKHQRGLRLADDAFVGGVMDLDRYKTQVDRLRSLIELEQSAKSTLEAAADAAKQRGSRADMLREVAASGPAMLATEDTAAANAWLRRYVRVLVRDNQVTDVVFNFW